MDEIAGSVVLITGGASGIGLGMAQSFLESGSTVVVADIDSSRFAHAARVLEDHRTRVEFVELDVADDDSWSSVVDAVWNTYGGIDILANNAGVGQGILATGEQARAWELPSAVRDLVLSVNVAGVMRGVAHVLPRMIERGRGGHVITTASVSGLVAVPGISLYSASKFAIVGFSEALAEELVPHGIGVSILCPGSVKSDLKTSAAQRDTDDNAGLEQYLDQLQRARSDKMEPIDVGRRTVEAVRRNDLYVMTHPVHEVDILRRHRNLEAAFSEGNARRDKTTGLILTRVDIDPDHEDDFNRWFDEEHVPERAGCPGIVSARRFRAIGSSPKYLAIYELDSLDVLESEPYRQLKPTDWQRTITPHVTYSERQIFEEITSPQTGSNT
ncbi:MAG: SDR family NAD(P)-dependent oxidoreductase [Rhodococcus sp. (in: high G+C Gram-positive bacteria)]